jgi:ADP-ribose pyrophosphatase
VPGGVIEGGETGEAAVARETLEEVGLDIPASEFQYFAALPNLYPFQGYVWPTLDLFYLARLSSFENIQAQASEVSDWKIIPLAEVCYEEFAFGSNAEAVRRLDRFLKGMSEMTGERSGLSGKERARRHSRAHSVRGEVRDE